MTYRLFDSSVWIYYKKGKISHHTNQLKHDILSNQTCICPVIIQEVLQRVRLDNEFDDLEDAFRGLVILNWDATDAAVSAAKLYCQLRLNSQLK